MDESKDQMEQKQLTLISPGFLKSVKPGGYPLTLYSSFTKLWQSCSDPHLKIRPITIFPFDFLNYSLVARLQDNFRPKSPTKVETKRKLQQFNVSGWLIMNGGESENEKKEHFTVEITFNMKRQHSYWPMFG